MFEARGAMPEAVIQTWSFIWSYFEQHPEINRSFLTDFETYKTPEEVHIYIGISSAQSFQFPSENARGSW